MKRRPETGPLPTRQLVRALLYDSFIWDAADRVERQFPRDEAIGGRPRDYPLVMALVWAGLVAIFGSSRKVERELACDESGWWDLVRDAAGDMRPGLEIPEAPMRRYHYEWLREKHLTHDGALFEICEQFREHAAAQAVMIGLCDSAGGGSLTHPSLERVVAGDGKVITPLFKTHPDHPPKLNKRTGEIRRKRVDPSADNYTTGGGTPVFGTRFVFISTRGKGQNRRIILDVAHAPTEGGEAKWALEGMHRVLPGLPGVQLVVYDGAFRGKHLRELMKIDGVIAISRVSKGKDRYLGLADVRRPDGRIEKVEVQLLNGSPHLRRITVDGSIIPTPLRRVKTRRNRNLDGWRWYNDYRVPEELGGGTCRLRLDQSTDDKGVDFNREENLRVIAPDDPDHAALYGLRADTESGNKQVDDSFLRERAHTVGWRRQQLDMIMYSARRNAEAVQLHRRVEQVEPPDRLAA